MATLIGVSLAVLGLDPNPEQGMCVRSCGTVHITIGDGGNNEGSLRP